jgi:hypothetical protein
MGADAALPRQFGENLLQGHLLLALQPRNAFTSLGAFVPSFLARAFASGLGVGTGGGTLFVLSKCRIVPELRRAGGIGNSGKSRPHFEGFLTTNEVVWRGLEGEMAGSFGRRFGECGDACLTPRSASYWQSRARWLANLAISSGAGLESMEGGTARPGPGGADRADSSRTKVDAGRRRKAHGHEGDGLGKSVDCWNSVLAMLSGEIRNQIDRMWLIFVALSPSRASC